ncbi:MAG: sigma-E factor negative regulatory protein RseC [Lysobacterales bacterium]
MIEQQARAIRAENGFVLVQIGGQTGCAACDEGKGCGAGLFGKLLNRKPVELLLQNRNNVKAGQAVQLGLAESLFMKLLFRLYAWPLVAGLAGATGGFALASYFGLSAGSQDLATLLGAVLCGLLVLNFYNRTTKPDISPNDIQLLDRPDAVDSCKVG